ncbi:MAG: hypothetical protein JO022_07380 [Acidobacteriaceae bacterium]|nr:hypothetical protein [Acidobacteriaceae bacterium]
MADTFQLEVATPERRLLDAAVSEAQWPCQNGYMGVLPGHAPLVSILGAGVLTYLGGAGVGRGVMKIEGGFVEVLNDHVRVLADKAEIAQDT